MSIFIQRLGVIVLIVILTCATFNTFYDYCRYPKSSGRYKSPDALALKRSLDQAAYERLQEARDDYEFRLDAYRRQVNSSE